MEINQIIMIVDKPEQTDGYGGLYGEVVDHDCYRLRSITWQPDVILDLGANIGVFARHARSLFPNALIVSVEPGPENIAHFKKFTNDKKIILLDVAIGMGDMWHCLGSPNGAHECYLSAGLGYDKEQMKSQEGISLEKSTITMTMPYDLIDFYVRPHYKTIIKIDIEGGENAIFTHEPSMKAISLIDYIVMEIHWYGLTGNVLPEVRKKTMDFIHRLKETHDCELNNTGFWAIKKKL